MSSDDDDNNRKRLPKGYGRRFDYARSTYDQGPVALNIPGFFPYFTFVRDLELSVEIQEWYDKIKIVILAKDHKILEPIGEGINGSYYCKDESGEKVAVFKPFDEEDKAPYNPKSVSSTGPIVGSTGPVPGSKIGKGAAREVAAYLLDHPTASTRREGFTGEIEGFCGVPPTLPIECMNNALNYQARLGSGFTTFDGHVKYYKFGSIQKYMEHDGYCKESDSEGLAVDLVHKICLLDIRYANADRHFGNLLAKKAEDNGPVKLIPIDHGYCFPENFKACRFDWLLFWKQPTRERFNQEAIEYVESLDSEKDIELLIHNHFTMSYTFARSLHISTRLLKEGVKRGLTPFEIGHFMCDKWMCDDQLGMAAADDEVALVVCETYLKLLGQSIDRYESVLEMIVCEAIKELVRKHLGNESVNDEEIIRKVEKESKLEGLNTTKQEVETELLDIIFQKMDEKLGQYADALQPLRK